MENNASSAETTSDVGPPTVEDVAVTSFGEGLDGDKDAVPPTIAWGIAVFMIGFTTFFIGSRWKKWPSYLIGFFPFIVAVAIWFFNLEKTLPS